MNHKLSFILIPDTQKMSRNHPDVFMNMTNCITDYAKSNSIDAVVHLGDVVDRGARVEEEFVRADEALSIIYQEDIPLLFVPGNHDYDVPIVSSVKEIEDEKKRSLQMFNAYFGLHRIQAKPWFGGVYENGKVENMYAIIKNHLFMMLEFGPRDEVLEWASDIIVEHHDKKVIVITHCYMYLDGTRTSDKHVATPKKYIATRDANDGEEIWQKLIKHHENIIGVFSGHHIPLNVSHRVDKGIHGNPVIQCFQNWQSEDYGGSGRFRIIEIDREASQLSTHVFNPLTGKRENEHGYELVFQF